MGPSYRYIINLIAVHILSFYSFLKAIPCWKSESLYFPVHKKSFIPKVRITYSKQSASLIIFFNKCFPNRVFDLMHYLYTMRTECKDAIDFTKTEQTVIV